MFLIRWWLTIFILYLLRTYLKKNIVLKVTMMLPGGYWVLGICLISCEEIWNTEWNYKKCKIIMKNIRDKLMLNHLFRGTTPSNDLILLHFNPINEKYVFNA